MIMARMGREELRYMYLNNGYEQFIFIELRRVPPGSATGCASVKHCFRKDSLMRHQPEFISLLWHKLVEIASCEESVPIKWKARSLIVRHIARLYDLPYVDWTNEIEYIAREMYQPGGM